MKLHVQEKSRKHAFPYVYMHITLNVVLMMAFLEYHAQTCLQFKNVKPLQRRSVKIVYTPEICLPMRSQSR